MAAIITSMIDFPSNDHTTPGFLARPEGDGSYPAVVAIQEWWGLNDNIRDIAQRLAREGYVVLAPDLYHGRLTEEPDEARKLAMALDRNRAVNEIAAAAAYLKGMVFTQSTKIGVVGWCMGGGLSLSAAAQSDDIGAAVAFYGQPLSAEDTRRLRVPVLGLFAENDQGISVDKVRTFEAELKANNIVHEIHIYGEGAQHAFFNDTRPHIFHPQASADAWERTLGWFQRYLT